MIRSASVILLIVTLAACPFRCMGALEAATPCENPTATCACCRPTAADSAPASVGEPSGGTGENGCDCCDCLCEGAVIDGHWVAPNLDAGTGIVLFKTSPPALVALQASRSPDFWDELDPSGRALRVLRQSFQI